MRNIFTFILIALSSSAFTQDTFSLQSAIDYAIANNLSMQHQAMDIQDAEQTVREFKSIGMPKADIGARYNYFFFRPTQPIADFITPAVYGTLAREELITEDRVPRPEDLETQNFSFARKNNLSLYANANMLLFDASYLKGLEAAKVSIDLAKERSKLSERDIAIGVTRAYLSTLVAEVNITFIEKNIENLEKTLSEVRELYKNGFVEQLDVDRLTISKHSLEAEKENIEKLIDLSYNALKFQMNYPLNTDITLLEDLDQLLSIVMITDEIDSIDVRNRPEYNVLYKAIILDGMDVDRLSKRLPTLSANVGLEGVLARDGLFNQSEPGFLPSGFVGLSLNYSLFDGNQKSAQMQRSKIRKEKRKLDLQQFQKGLELEYLNAHTQLINAKRTLKIQQQVLDLSEDVYAKTQIKYKEGVGSSFEVKQAEADVYNAQASYVSAMYDVVLAHAELDIALGKIK